MSWLQEKQTLFLDLKNNFLSYFIILFSGGGGGQGITQGKKGNQEEKHLWDDWKWEKQGKRNTQYYTIARDPQENQE